LIVPFAMQKLVSLTQSYLFTFAFATQTNSKMLIKNKKKSLPRTKSRCLYSPEEDEQEAINIVNKKNMPHIEI